MSRASSRARAGAPGPVVECLAQARTKWGTRIYANGDSEEWVEGAGWRPLVHLDVVVLTALLGMVRESGFYALPATIEPTIPVRDGTTVTWTVDLDGRRHTVTARRLNFEPNPVLQRLHDEVQRVIGEALNREAGAAQADDTGSPARLTANMIDACVRLQSFAPWPTKARPLATIRRLPRRQPRSRIPLLSTQHPALSTGALP